jgi:hypothetical protein
MYRRLSNTLSVAAVALALIVPAVASHKTLNGTWVLKSGQDAVPGQTQSGTITINDRERNITISRNFTYASENQTVSYTFTTDGQEGANIHDGKSFKSKAKWDGDVLKVVTVDDGVTTVESFTLEGDGVLRLVTSRGGQAQTTLRFMRQ